MKENAWYARCGLRLVLAGDVTRGLSLQEAAHDSGSGICPSPSGKIPIQLDFSA